MDPIIGMARPPTPPIVEVADDMVPNAVVYGLTNIDKTMTKTNLLKHKGVTKPNLVRYAEELGIKAKSLTKPVILDRIIAAQMLLQRPAIAEAIEEEAAAISQELADEVNDRVEGVVGRSPTQEDIQNVISQRIATGEEVTPEAIAEELIQNPVPYFYRRPDEIVQIPPSESYERRPRFQQGPTGLVLDEDVRLKLLAEIQKAQRERGEDGTPANIDIPQSPPLLVDGRPRFQKGPKGLVLDEDVRLKLLEEIQDAQRASGEAVTPANIVNQFIPQSPPRSVDGQTLSNQDTQGLMLEEVRLKLLEEIERQQVIENNQPGTSRNTTRLESLERAASRVASRLQERIPSTERVPSRARSPERVQSLRIPSRPRSPERTRSLRIPSRTRSVEWVGSRVPSNDLPPLPPLEILPSLEQRSDPLSELSSVESTISQTRRAIRNEEDIEKMLREIQKPQKSIANISAVQRRLFNCLGLTN
jgi:hypothetical protein